MKENIIGRIIEYFKDNEDVFNECIEELDNYNGHLVDNRYYEMEAINELFDMMPRLDLLYRAFYGHDADKCTEDSNGNIIYGEFNPNRNYFYYNGYGNLVSSDYKDYSDHLDSYTIEAMQDHRPHIYTIGDDEELESLFDELEDI